MLEYNDIEKEYIIAGITHPDESTQVATLVPTTVQDKPRRKRLVQKNGITYQIGDTVILNNNKIRLPEYDTERCDTMTVWGMYDQSAVFRAIRLTEGKKFDDLTLTLKYEPVIEWYVKFLDTVPGDECLVQKYTSQEKENVAKYDYSPEINDYRILRNYTLEKIMQDFFVGKYRKEISILSKGNNMNQCDIMIVWGIRNMLSEFREITLLGKKFGNVVLTLCYPQLWPNRPHWHDKFIGVERGDICIVRRYKKEENKKDIDNNYRILASWALSKSALNTKITEKQYK